MATKSWKLAGTLSTFSTANPVQALTTSPLEQSAQYTEHVLQSGQLDTDPGGAYYDVPMGPISLAKMLEYRCDTPISIRINGSLVVPNCTRWIQVGEITQLELQRQVSGTPVYWVQFFD